MHHTDIQFQEGEIHKNQTNSKNLIKAIQKAGSLENLEAFQKHCVKNPGKLFRI